MAKTLDVYFHEQVIGQLIQDNQGEMNFQYSADWLANPQAIRISCSLPLQQQAFSKRNCQAFFSGILPEESQRKIIAKNLGISAYNDFSMLEKIGGECAGALSFISTGEELTTEKCTYNELTNASLAKILKGLPSRPLLAGDKGVRLSLAGVQDKLAVYVENEKTFIPLNNSPSTHILKLNFDLYNDVIFNEAFCLNLAKKVGLPAAEASLKKAEETDYLLIKRYDRFFEKSLEVKRAHQEDFCQALGVSPANKYQCDEEPSLKQCFNLLRSESTRPIIDLERMLDAVIFNFLIGNCDAHSKNFSLLYDGQTQLAPLYDLICTLHYKDLSRKMAMKLGGEYRIDNISIRNFDKLSEEIGFAKPEVRRRVFQLTDKVLATLAGVEVQHPAQEKIANLIKTRCEDFAKSAVAKVMGDVS